MQDLKQASARSAAWNLLQNLVSRFLALAVVGVQSRLIDRSAFGAAALALAITSVAELLQNQGYGEFVTQTPNLEDTHLDTAFWFNTSVGAALTALLVVFAPSVASLLGDSSATSVIQWTALTLVLRSFSVVPSGLLMRKLAFRSLSLRSLIASAIGGVAGIVAAVVGLGVYSLVVQVLVSDVTAAMVLWRATDWRPGRRLSWSALKQLSAYGTPVIGAGLLGFFSRRIDTVIVGGALGLATLGVYSLAQRVYQIVLQVLNKSSVEVVFSAFSRLADTEERRRQAFLKVIEITAVTCFPAYVGLAIIAKPITIVLFGSNWADGGPVLTWFALAGIPYSLSLIHMAALKSAAATRAWFVTNAAQLVIYLPALLLLYRSGPAAAAAASLIGCVAILPFELAAVKAALGSTLGPYLRALVGATLATSVMAAATLGVAYAVRTTPALAQVVVVSVAGAGVYIAALRGLAPASFRRCIDIVRQTLRRK